MTDAADNWLDPIPLMTKQRKPFPVEVLPPLLRDAVQHLATTRKVHPVLPFTAFGGVISGLFAEGMSVAITPSWIDPVNCYFVVVATSGDGKTPAFAPASALLKVVDALRIEVVAVDQIEANARMLEIPVELKQALKVADRQEVRKLVKEREEHQKTLRRTGRIIVQDATPEATADLMARNDGLLVVADAEGTIVQHVLGVYSSNPNISLWLAGWSGEPYYRDRVREEGAKEVTIDAAIIGVGAALQPLVYQTLLQDPRANDRGLVARALADWPPSMAGRRLLRDVFNHPGDATFFDPLQKRVQKVWAASRNGRTMVLSPAAQERFVAWHDSYETSLHSRSDMERRSIPKLRASAARMAAWYQPLVNDRVEVHDKWMEAAITTCDYYFEGHAHSADKAEFEDAFKVLRWLAEQPADVMSVRDIYRGVGWHRYAGGVKRAKDALAVLYDHNWVRDTSEKNVVRHPRMKTFLVDEI